MALLPCEHTPSPRHSGISPTNEPTFITIATTASLSTVYYPTRQHAVGWLAVAEVVEYAYLHVLERELTY